MRKFRKNRMALVATCVILVYFVAALTVFFGMISLDDTRLRVGPNRVPGFFEQPSRDQRVKFAQWNFETIDRKLSNFQDGKLSADDLRRQTSLAERQLLDVPVEELVVAFAQVREVYDVFDEVYAYEEVFLDEVLAIEDELGDAEADGDDELVAELSAELDEIMTEGSGAVEETDAALTDVELAIDQIRPMPKGWGGFVYRLRTFLGTDSQGASISTQGFYSIKIAFQVGLVTALICVIVGTILGAAAAYYGGWVDAIILWIISTLSSIPYLVLLAVLAYMFVGTIFDQEEKPGLALVKLYISFGVAFWIPTCRVVRGEVMKIKELEYVQAATALGFGRFYILLKHIVPNTTHLMFINFSLLFIGAIKSEVILTFLGLGVKGQPSWGRMISLGADGVVGFFFWEVGVATVFMFGLVLAFNIVSDALQDAFDPKHVS